MNIWAYTGGSGILGGNVMTPRAANAGAVSHDGVIVMTDLIVPNPDSANNLKRCSKCREIKPRTAFYAYNGTKDGLQRHCIDCQKRYRSEHLAEKLAYNKQWKKDHPERARENARRGTQAYRERNRERVREADRAQKREWRKTNPDDVVAIRHRSRARRRAAGGNHTQHDLESVRAAQTDRKGRLICWRCGKPIKGTPHLDHWIPLAGGGTNDAGNLHYMHPKCNQTKSAKMPTEIGRLL